MKKFLVVERQDGGCDYTIGCGLRVSELEAKNMDEALEMVRQNSLSEDEGVWLMENAERCRDSVMIYEIADEAEAQLDDWRDAEKDRKANEQAKKIEKKEIAEYKRLQRKYGDRYDE